MGNSTEVIEDASQKELASTEINRTTAKVLSLGFVIAVTIPFLIQILYGFPRGEAFEEFRELRFPPSHESLGAFEAALDRTSILKSYIQPRLQGLLTGAGGFGNEKVTLGRGGWLYYAPGLKYIYGDPFLSSDLLRSRAKAMIDKEGIADPNPDPTASLLLLAADCRRWNIELFLLPVADKGMVVSRPIARQDASARLQNPDYDRLASRLRAAGVRVLDTAEILRDAGDHSFLKQDTHWTPSGMEAVAVSMARQVNDARILSAAPAAAMYRRGERRVSNRGDLVGMLKLTSNQGLYPIETVTTHPISLAATGGDYVPAAGAEVLLLGDSFANIYSSRTLKWGEGAGLAEHLAYELNRPVDLIALNGSGATGVRNELVRAVTTGRLNSTRVLVYEFAIRDLALEDWKPVALPPPPSGRILTTGMVTPKPLAKAVSPASILERAPAPKVEIQPAPLVIVGRVLATSRVPEPGTAPYKNCIVIDKFEVTRLISGALADKTILVALSAMEDDVWTSAARFLPGDEIRLTLTPFSKASRSIQSTQRSDDVQDFDSPLFWAERSEKEGK